MNCLHKTHDVQGSWGAMSENEHEAVAKQQIPTIYSSNTFRYWIHIVELLIFATAPVQKNK